eukprot:scaffold16412_cov59-Phaeocystis_antarctica.AAC.5
MSWGRIPIIDVVPTFAFGHQISPRSGITKTSTPWLSSSSRQLSVAFWEYISSRRRSTATSAGAFTARPVSAEPTHLTVPQVALTFASQGEKPELPKTSWQKCPGFPPHSLASLVAPRWLHHASGFGQCTCAGPWGEAASSVLIAEPPPHPW